MLDRKLPETEQYEIVAHLDECEGCSKKLESIAAGGREVGSIVKHLGREKPEQTSAYWPALRKIESELQQTGDPELHLSRTRSEEDSASIQKELSLDFLDPADPDRPESVGRIDRFHILNVIGRGGMGVVFRAMDGCLERIVAIKMLDPQFAKNELAHDRFCREARSAAKIMHENVVTIHHVDENEPKNLPYIVMQYIGGKSLQDLLDNKKPLDLYEIVRIGKQTAAGLGAAHAQNLIHRDVKPANILLEERTGRVLLTDFGLARMNEDVKLTQTGFVAGTPLFMSPEQARGEPVDYRSDLFSLGSVLYAMCTGKPPFEGSTPFLVLRSVTELSPKPLQEVNPAIPDWLVDLIETLLAKDPKRRFQSADEVSEILEQRLVTLPRRGIAVTGTRYRSAVLPRIARSTWGRRFAYVGLASLCLTGCLIVAEAAKLTRWTVLGQRGLSLSSAGGLTAAEQMPAEPRQVLGGTTRTGTIYAVAYNPKGDLVATACEDGVIRLWDPATGTAMGNIQAHKGPVWGVAFNSEGTEIASCGDDGFLRTWSLNNTQKERKWTRVETGARSLAFSKDGRRIAVGTRDGLIQIHNMETGVIDFSMEGGHSGTVTAVAFSPDEQVLATASSDQTVKTWSVKRVSLLNVFKESDGTGSVYTLAFDPEGKILASAGWDHKIRIWDAHKGDHLKTIQAHQSDVWKVAFDPKDRYLVSVGNDRMVKFWDTKTWEERMGFLAHEAPIYTVAISPDGKSLITASRDGTAQVWDAPKW